MGQRTASGSAAPSCCPLSTCGAQPPTPRGGGRTPCRCSGWRWRPGAGQPAATTGRSSRGSPWHPTGRTGHCLPTGPPCSRTPPPRVSVGGVGSRRWERAPLFFDMWDRQQTTASGAQVAHPPTYPPSPPTFPLHTHNPAGRPYRTRWRGLPAANWLSFEGQDRASYMYDSPSQW